MTAVRAPSTVDIDAAAEAAAWARFRRLWLGQSVSMFGSGVTAVALPLVAVLMLDATALQVGLLTSASYVAYAVLGLVAGVLTDRWQRRRVMLVADAGRLVAVAAVPVLALAGGLRMWHLLVVALVVGTLTLFFETAHQAYLPAVLPRHLLVAGNARFQASASVTELAGPGAAALLVRPIGAAMTLVVDAVSYLVSFLAVLSVRGVTETHLAPAALGEHRPATMGGQIAEAFRYIRRDRVLFSFLFTIAQFNLLITAEQALNVLFLVDVVRVSATVVGLLLAVGGIGAVAGALVAARVTARLGEGRALVLAAVLGPVLGLLIPATHGGLALACFVVGLAGLGLTTTILKVVVTSYRQAVVPAHLLGRVVATNRVLTWGPLPLGGLLGGLLGEALGLRGALFVLAIALCTAPAWLLFTPAWRLRDFKA